MGSKKGQAALLTGIAAIVLLVGTLIYINTDRRPYPKAPKDRPTEAKGEEQPKPRKAEDLGLAELDRDMDEVGRILKELETSLKGAKAENLPQRDRDKWLKMVLAVFARAKNRADYYLLNDDLGTPKRIYEKLLKSAFPEIRQLAQKELYNLETYQKRLVTEIAPERRRLYVEYVQELAPLLESREYDRVEERIKQYASGNHRFKKLGPILSRDLGILAGLKHTFRFALEGAKKKVGSKVEITPRGGKPVRGKLIAVDKAAVRIQQGSKTPSIRFSDMDAESVIELAEDSGKPIGPMSLPLLLAYEMDHERAIQALLDVMSRNLEDTDLLLKANEIADYLELLEEGNAQKDIAKGLDEAARLKDKGDETKAAEIIERLRKRYELTEAYRKAKPELDKLIPPPPPPAAAGPNPRTEFEPGLSTQDKLEKIAEYLTRKSHHGVAKNLIPALWDPDRGVKVSTCRALAQMKVGREEIWALSEVIADPDPAVGYEAVAALEKIGRGRTTQNVRKYLTSKNYYERHIATLAIAFMKTPEAASLMMRMLRDPHWRVRKTAVIGLTRVNAKGSAGQLLSVLKREENHEVRETIAVALGVFQYPPAADDLMTLVQDNPTMRGRGKIMQTVSEMAVLNHSAQLKKLLKDKDPAVRHHAIVALKRTKVSLRAKELQPLVSDPVWEVRAAAVELAGSSPDPAALSLVIERLGDAHETVRYITGITLAQYRDGKGAVGQVIQKLSSLSDQAFQGALDYLKQATQQEFGTEASGKKEIAAAYRKWWINYGGSFRVPGGTR